VRQKNRAIVSHMQLVQIGEPKPPTIQQLFQQLAARQAAEIEQLK